MPLDVGLPDDPDGVDDDDAAPPDAGVGRRQAEAGHQLHDEPRQHGQLPRQGQAAPRGGGERPARGPQVGEEELQAWLNLLKSRHIHRSYACSIPATEQALIDELKNYFLSNVFGSNLILISLAFNPLQSF